MSHSGFANSTYAFSLYLNESNDNVFLILTGISLHNLAPLKVID